MDESSESREGEIISSSGLESGDYQCQSYRMASCSGVPFSAGDVASSGTCFAYEYFGISGGWSCASLLSESFAGVSS